MKLLRISSLFLLIGLISLGIFFTVPDFTKKSSPPPVTYFESEIDIPATTTAPANPPLNARYACVTDVSSGRLLYEKEARQKAPMASTTKIMTLLLALESGKTGETVTASAYAASMPKVHLGMAKGYQYKMQDLLYSLMLESHNDTAVAIAEHIAGSVENFAALMNEKAAELGMTDTHFVTPNGLDDPEHYSTPADMCRLAAFAIQREDFCNIIQCKSYRFSTIDGAHSYSLSNKDAFLSYYDGALGIKTGFTGNAGYCFVGAAKRGSMCLTSCVLASGWPPNKSYKWTDTKNLMNFGFNNYSQLTFPLQDITAVKIPVLDGKSSYVLCQQPESAVAPVSRFDNLHITYELPQQLNAPVDKNHPVGNVHFYINGDLYASQKIFPSESVEKSVLSDTILNVFTIWMESFGL